MTGKVKHVSPDNCPSPGIVLKKHMLLSVPTESSDMRLGYVVDNDNSHVQEGQLDQDVECPYSICDGDENRRRLDPHNDNFHQNGCPFVL